MSKSGLIVMFLLVSQVSGCASLLVTRPSTGSAASASTSTADARITNRINSALVREPGISSLDVYVSTYQGSVTLKGYVSSQQLKNRAAEIAYSVSGVKSVRNQLRMK